MLDGESVKPGPGEKCRRDGCEREAFVVREGVPLCPEDDVALIRIFCEWVGLPGFRRKAEDYQIGVERQLGRGLYGQSPLFRPPIDWSEQQRLSIAGAPSQ